jgi:hypothetical protein
MNPLVMRLYNAWGVIYPFIHILNHVLWVGLSSKITNDKEVCGKFAKVVLLLTECYIYSTVIQKIWIPLQHNGIDNGLCSIGNCWALHSIINELVPILIFYFSVLHNSGHSLSSFGNCWALHSIINSNSNFYFSVLHNSGHGVCSVGNGWALYSVQMHKISYTKGKRTY